MGSISSDFIILPIRFEASLTGLEMRKGHVSNRTEKRVVKMDNLDDQANWVPTIVSACTVN